MEVSDEGANARQVVGIEDGGGSGPLSGNGWMVFGTEREAPKPGPTFLAPAGEEDGVVFGKDGYAVFLKEHFAAMGRELADSDEVVFEGGYDLGITDRHVRKWEVVCC